MSDKIDDIIEFADEKSGSNKSSEDEVFCNILVVDDEKEIHSVTSLVLNNRLIGNKRVRLISVYSAKEAIEYLKSHNDIALILLDVVMEEENSGLLLVKYIREDLNNKLVRIILRTGYPGSAPEETVITEYDINDYKNKTELTSEKLFTTVYSSLRTYDELLSNLKMIDEITDLKNFLKSIIESLNSSIITTDNNLIITHCNNTAKKLSGKDSFEGKYFGDLFPVFESVTSKIWEYINRKDNNCLFDLRREKIEGDSIRYYDISVVPVNSDPEYGFVIRIDDVTEDELKDRQLKEIQKMDMVGSLAGGLAHDFNNALGGIIGMISLIRHQLTIKPDTVISEFLEMMEQASNHTKGMITQLKALTTPSDTKFVSVNLGDLIRRITKFCATTFDKSVAVEYNDPHENLIISADPTQIEQVILNLCINGCHAMTIMRNEGEEHGGKLAVSVREITADEGFIINHPEAHIRNYYMIQICDNGVGISKKNLTKIFDPFFTTKPKGKGTGLGLSMVNSILRAHNGFIDVYSEVGVETTFSIYIPVMAMNGETYKDENNRVIVKGSGKILVVEDIEIMAYTISQMLKRCGYEVVVAYDGIQGIEKFKDIHKELKSVIVDIDIPKKSGISLIREMRTINPDLPVIASSGYFDDERHDTLSRLGVAVRLEKPFDLYTLSSELSKVIKQVK